LQILYEAANTRTWRRSQTASCGGRPAAGASPANRPPIWRSLPISTSQPRRSRQRW